MGLTLLHALLPRNTIRFAASQYVYDTLTAKKGRHLRAAPITQS